MDELESGPRVTDDRAALAERLLREILTRLGVSADIAARASGDQVSVRVTVTAGGEGVGLEGERAPLWEPIGHLLSKMIARDPAHRVVVRMETGAGTAANAAGSPPSEGAMAGQPVPELPAVEEEVDEELSRLARELAGRAKALGKILAVGPLDARLRRAMHLAVKDVPALSTRSEGEGGARRLLFVPDVLAPTPDGPG